MDRKILHFSLGPVQSFVEQARRTRDLWAGSFLLSWLAGQAMVRVRQQGGRIVFPTVARGEQVTDPLIAALEGSPRVAQPNPSIGSLPNRFKAEVPVDFDAANVEEAVRSAWKNLAEAVWQAFVETAAEKGDDTRAIWTRQIEGFWDMIWVIGDDRGDGSDALWLEARKNWRQRWPAPEGGDHCALMHDWQELSGHVCPGGSQAQKAFWEALRGGVGALELRDNERLCAIALIKRLFPRLSKDALQTTIGWVPGGKSEAVGNWPSTPYMAVVPWLRAFVNDAERTRCLQDYEDSVLTAAGRSVRGERSADIKSLRALGELAWLDGNFFMPTALANKNHTPLGNTSDADDSTVRHALLQQLNEDLQAKHPAQPWYALLLLDGDHLGKQLRKGDPATISLALGEFSTGVAAIVGNYDGVALYAGGDDVLALLPCDKALECARSLRNAYGNVFAGQGLDKTAFTASAAIVYAHYQLPLRSVLGEAHRQLDTVAKDKNGRDSLALAWCKPSGMAAQWVATWRDQGGHDSIENLQQLTQLVRAGSFPTGFFYKLRTRYAYLGQLEGEAALHENVGPLLHAEYVKTRESSTPPDQARSAIDTLLAVSRRVRRDDQGRFIDAPGLQLDALRLARLLAGKEN